MALAIRIAVLGLFVASVPVAATVLPATNLAPERTYDGGVAAEPAVHTCPTPPCPTPTRTWTPTSTSSPSTTPTADISPTSSHPPNSMWDPLETLAVPIATVVALLVALLTVKYGR